MALHKYLWNVFWGICVLVALVASVRAWDLRLLYSNSAVRDQVETVLQEVAEREGWLISDISLRTIADEGMQIHHRQHIRGFDPVECYFIHFTSSDLSPCMP